MNNYVTAPSNVSLFEAGDGLFVPLLVRTSKSKKKIGNILPVRTALTALTKLLCRALINWALQVHVAKDNSILGDDNRSFA